MVVDYKKLWNDALVEIELNVSRANFITWFKNTAIVGEEDGTVFLSVPNTFVQEWLSTKFNKFILGALHGICPSIRNIEYLINPEEPPATEKKTENIINVDELKSDEQLGFSELYVDKEANLNPKYTFDSFVVCSFNEVAYAAALAVTKNLGTSYNPLFIYGGVGLGKTHLLQSVGNKIKQENPNAKVHYLTSEKFANDFVVSMKNSAIHSFKEKYRKYDLLIVDDIQFFSDKLKIQEEFFHIFNSLYDKNNQIIFSSDRSPKYIVGLEERLRSRFEGGMMVDISKPEYESRLAILKSKSEAKGFLVDDNILDYIASFIQSNIRELEGALNSIIGQCKIRGRILSLNEIKELLKKNAKPEKTVTISQVIRAVTDFYNIEEKSLFEKTRRKEIVKPRQVAMYLLRVDLRISYPYIGEKFGQRDHTTVIHAYKKIDRTIEKDDKLNKEISDIREILFGKN